MHVAAEKASGVLEIDAARWLTNACARGVSNCPSSYPQFVCNGLLWPDRSLHPAAFEVKQLQAPLGISLAGTAGDEGPSNTQQQQPGSEVRLLLRNKQHFSSTAGLALRWRLLADGLPVVAAGAAACKTPAGGGAGAEGWQPLQVRQPLGPQQEAAVGLGVSWAELAQQAQHAAEASLEVQAQVGSLVS